MLDKPDSNEAKAKEGEEGIPDSLDRFRKMKKKMIDLSQSLSDFSLTVEELSEICDDAKIAIGELSGCTKE